MQRLFVALWPDDATRDALVRARALWPWPRGAALVKPERLHLTLHFLGNVDETRIDDVKAALRIPAEPFTLAFGRGAVWHGGVGVLLPSAVPEALVALQEATGRALQAAGIALEDRPYRPHVTFARRAFGVRVPQESAGIDWQVRQGHVLVRTMPGNGRYEILQRY